ncbi:MAG: hypothetical protein R3E08_01830 [Thiotrichaceae bacterium]
MDELFSNRNSAAVKSSAPGGGYFLLFANKGTSAAMNSIFGQYGKESPKLNNSCGSVRESKFNAIFNFRRYAVKILRN